MVLFEIASDFDSDSFLDGEVVVERYSAMEQNLPARGSIPDDNNYYQDDITGPVEVTVLQLLPDFDGCFDDSSGGAVSVDDIVSYTSEDLNDLQKEVNMDEADDEFAEELLQDPFLLPALGISPAVVQRIRSDSLGKSDFMRKKKQQVEEEEENGDLAPDFFPTFLGRLSPRLSLSYDGFIMLNDYKISPDTLGGGKLSEVRLAYSEKDHSTYAVKIHSKMKLQKHNLLLRTSRNPLEEVYREIDILKKLDHPNIIRLIDVVEEEDEDNLYLVFERLDRELMTIPAETPFTEDEARRVFKEILSGVDCMHKNDIVHRDLKPENMLLHRDGTVKIADFGFCEYMSHEPNGADSMSTTSTHGTPAFTPPECLSSNSHLISGRAMDIWSLGITLFALVTGDVPFKADSMPQLFESIKKDKLEFPVDKYNLSSTLKDLITRLLAKDPTDRPCIDDIRTHPWMDGECHQPRKLLMSVGSFTELDDF